MNVFKDPKVIVNLVLLAVSLLSALHVSVGVDNATAQTCVAAIATLFNGGVHAANASGH